MINFLFIDSRVGFLFILSTLLVVTGICGGIRFRDRILFWLFSATAIVIMSATFLSSLNSTPSVQDTSGNIVIVKMGEITTMNSSSHPIIIMIDGKVIFKNIGTEELFKRMGNP